MRTRTQTVHAGQQRRDDDRLEQLAREKGVGKMETPDAQPGRGGEWAGARS